jgi:hypothetical protein
VCALVPVVGRPAPGVALLGTSWHPAWVQLVADVTPFVAWLNVAGTQAVVIRWHDEHCDAVVIWLTLAGVNPLPL